MKLNIKTAFAGLFLLAILTTSFTLIQKEKPVVGVKIGDIAPEIKLSDPEGNEMLLSDLKGKLVLIDFWASWCGPCRMENPNVVAAYNKYKNAKWKSAKGFEVYSVSLDRNRGAWVNAIKKDKLEWPYHVSDLKYWSSKAAGDYKVTGIPTNFLVNEKGIILAKGLRGKNLHTTLDKYVKSLK